MKGMVNHPSYREAFFGECDSQSPGSVEMNKIGSLVGIVRETRSGNPCGRERTVPVEMNSGESCSHELTVRQVLRPY